MVSTESPHGPVLPPRFFFGVSLAAVGFFALWTWVVRPWAPPPSFDMSWAEIWRDWSETHAAFSGVMVYLTDIGGVAAMALLTVMAVIWQSAVHNRTLVVAWIAVMIGCVILNSGTKHIFDRARPGELLRAPVVHERNPSYPSGHSMGSTIGYGMLAYSLLLAERRRGARALILLLCATIVLGVGLSRIYLRAHWLSDVVAGWTVGLAWLFFCLGWLERWMRTP
ncbi:MAG: phosphatase PAP2 family protein [Gemmataceae bacterium]|nr:phosphatase PAP2 family protein [Gemmataceae bacterium]